jgi:hypothetical protein
MVKVPLQHRPDGTYHDGPSCSLLSRRLRRGFGNYDSKTSWSRDAFRPRPTITMPTAYAANSSAGTIGAYSIASRNFELQQRVTADLLRGWVGEVRRGREQERFEWLEAEKP